MAKILNIAGLHNNGASELVIGIRGKQFKLKLDNDTVSLIDPSTNKLLKLNAASVVAPDNFGSEDISKEGITSALGYTPISEEDMKKYIEEALLGGAW